MDASYDLRLLRMFIAVAETGTLSKAADRLARTQAAVSMQLQRIEKELDTQLFTRSSRGVSLTQAGEAFLAYARRVIALTEDMQRGLVDKKLVGRIRLGLFEDLAVTRLPGAIAEFKQKHPSVDIELSSSHSTQLARSFDEGQIDIVVADPARFTQPPLSFISYQLVWCASRLLDVNEEEPLPVVLFETSCSWQDRMVASLAEAGLVWTVGCRVKSLTAMLSALRGGLGIGVLFSEAVPPDCETINGRYNLPAAPVAEFGVYTANASSPLVSELAKSLEALA
ncbi:LysR family transcriptional regulator [Ochrobactrum quorumnocens]|uniref:LysR family transcriptional regulator n=1 Tax=Ochrobactrum quorumnocens TaxID=271865 RepID=UPI000AEA488D